MLVRLRSRTCELRGKPGYKIWMFHPLKDECFNHNRNILANNELNIFYYK